MKDTCLTGHEVARSTVWKKSPCHHKADREIKMLRRFAGPEAYDDTVTSADPGGQADANSGRKAGRG